MKISRFVKQKSYDAHHDALHCVAVWKERCTQQLFRRSKTAITNVARFIRVQRIW